jgi:hypothetical protein
MPPNTDLAHIKTCPIKPLSVILVKYSLTLPDDGPCVIRNMLEWFLKYFKKLF